MVGGGGVSLTVKRSSSVGEKVCPDLRCFFQLAFYLEDSVADLGLDVGRADCRERDPGANVTVARE